MPAHLDNACQFRAWLQRKFIISKSSFSSPPSPSQTKLQSMVEPVEETQTSGSCNLLLCKQFFARCVACLRSSAWLAILHATAGPGEAGGVWI